MSHDQSSSPVTASNHLITPEGASSFWPSSTCWPVTMTPSTIVGAAVMDTMPGTILPMPVLMLAEPFCPKSWQGRPVSASTATRRPSSVPSIMRVWHSAAVALGVS